MKFLLKQQHLDLDKNDIQEIITQVLDNENSTADPSFPAATHDEVHI